MTVLTLRHGAVILAMGLAFGAIAVRLATIPGGAPSTIRLAVSETRPFNTKPRPDIVDRNGQILATDVTIHWLHANPRLILDPDDAAERLAQVLPGEDAAVLRRRLMQNTSFVWLRRDLVPRQADAVFRLGIPGLFITDERRRAYPSAETAVHVVGHTNVDNRGVSGLEFHLDRMPEKGGQAVAGHGPVRLTLDLRVQHILRGELAEAMTRYRAKAAAGLVMDATDGAILAMSSLPDYDPNRREKALDPSRRNRLVADAYELGSVFKALTVAMALDAGLLSPRDEIDVATPLRIGRFSIADKYARTQYATVEDILVRSSNTGAARIAMLAGGRRQLEFLQRLGLFDRPQTELGTLARPIYPELWRPVNTATAAYGHGIAVSPLAFAAAVCALVNGGHAVTPHVLARDGSASLASRARVVREETSAAMRGMLHQAVERGTGKRARIPGYAIGGKTGTAYKPGIGGYSKAVINSFFAVVPAEAPRYLLFVMIDEPQAEDGSDKDEAAYNAVPVAGRILARALPALGLAPQLAADHLARSHF